MKGRLRPNPNAVYTPRGEKPGKFWIDDDATGKYDSLLSNIMVDRNVYRLIAIIAVCALVACIGVLAYTVSLPETELVVIGVNDIGEAKYYGKSRGVQFDGYDMQEAIAKNILIDFVTNTFMITTDSELMYNNYKDAMFYLEADKRKHYELDINDRDPFKDVGRIKNVVSVETVIPVSGSTWQVDWVEEWKELHGGQGGKVRKRGIFTFRRLNSKQYNALKEEVRVKNPLGIYITDYNIVEKE